MQEMITDLEDATQSLPGLIKPETVLGTMAGWDSLGVVAFITAVAERYQVELAADALKACATVADLHALILQLQAQPVAPGLASFYPAVV
jgi:acyl carrier protein